MELGDLGFDRLLAALTDAPTLPEWAVGRVADNRDGAVAYTALRWDVGPDRRRPAVLTPLQHEVLQRLVDGERINTIRDDNSNTYQKLRGAANRLGAVSPYQTVAVAVALGLVTVRQEYALGPAYRISAHVCRQHDRPEDFLAPSLRATLLGICNGMTNQEIADWRGVGLDTVKTNVAQLITKFGARNRSHLAALAVRWGLVY